MKFVKGSRRKAIEYEKDLVRYWKQHKTFEKSVQQRPADDSYVFYDGPPFITGVPHHGTLLSSIVKDAVPRYWTMKGKRVERVWGWDCHGLPAENFVEKKLGITDRHDIGTKISLEKYITTARESMVQTSGEWEDTVDRIGRWVDFKGAYKTMDKDYMESVWWAFKQLYEKGKIYEGYRVLMYDTKWATPLSKAEVTMDAGAYQTVTDPSVYVKFKLENYADFASRIGIVSDPDEDKKVYMLAWTTTPWTLPGNIAVAINPKITYVTVGIDDEVFVVAEELVDKIFQDEKHNPINHKVFNKFKGKSLVGLRYEPLLGKTVTDGILAACTAATDFSRPDDTDFMVHAADYVSDESGTGIVHLAPAYGEEDFELAKREGLRILSVLDDYGVYWDAVAPYAGREVWSSNKYIAKDLLERGIVWKIDYIQHEYPHNLRNGNRLMYRAHPSWFMDIDGQRTEMLEENTEHINWFPEHVKHGRFEKTVLQAPDWNLSRDRFWATAMPVWKGTDKDGKEHIKVVGSYAELKELSGVELEDYHRPWVDDVTFEIDGIEYKRIDKVLDCWFESGSMPFAQFHYPFENVEKFENNFPGDFIVEYIGQVRAWFYYMHAVNVGLFGHNAFKNVIVTGNIAGNDGFKMSKSRGNFTDPNELMDKYSADSWRFLLLGSTVLNGEDFALHDKDVGDVARKLSMIWNMYDFFTLYADVDGWDSGLKNGELPPDPMPGLHNPLDQWVISRVHQLSQEIDKSMQTYDLPGALKPILPFIDDASNWYVRRSRKRFWKSDNDDDKQQAYRTLHYVLVRLSLILAPFTPFLAEELYQKLTGGESVHLLDWPEAGHINELLVSDMHHVREAITVGLSQRADAGIRVRQPLPKVTIPASFITDESAREEVYAPIIAEELNVKQVKWGEQIELDTEITPQLKAEGQMREVIRHVQKARKEAGLDVDDRIHLAFSDISGDLKEVFANKELNDYLLKEVLAVPEEEPAQEYAYSTTIKIDGAELTIMLSKS